MAVLVTRPAVDGAATAARLEAAGYEAVVAPLMTIEPQAPALDLTDAQGLLVTSANGARAAAAATSRRDIAVYAVGAASAAAARAAGFAEVASADGDVAALVGLVRARVDPAGGRLVHGAGQVTAGGADGDLAAQLRRAGFTVDRVTLYTAATAEALPAPAVAGLTAGRIEAVLLYSPRSAALFAELVKKAGQACDGVVAVCLSQAVAAALGDVAFRGVVVADQPTEDDLLAVLTSALKAGAQNANS